MISTSGHELVDARCGRFGCAVRRVAEVDRRLCTRRESRSPRCRHASSVTEITSRKTRPSISTSRGSSPENRRKPFERDADRVHAEPRPSRVRGTALEDDARIQVAETAELQRVVRRLEADDELRLVDEAGLLEDAGQGVLRRAELLAREEEQSPGRKPSSVSAAQSASSIITARPPFMSLAPSPTTAPSSIRPGRFPCAGTVSVWPARRTSGLPLRFAKISDSPSSNSPAAEGRRK